MVTEDIQIIPPREFVRDKFLAKEIIILDGLTGSGKTMFSPIISSLKGVQNPRFEYMFEYLLISGMLGKISRDASFSLLNLLADIKFYDGLISRDVNFRPADLSGVLANRKLLRYVLQLFMKDGPAIEKRLERNNDKLFLITHQILGCLEELNFAFKGRVKVVQMVRHPIYLIDHWMSYIDMHGSNPRDFTIWLNSGNSELVPWFAEGFAEDYIRMSSMEKVLYSIDYLMGAVYETKRKKSSHVFMIPFETFVLDPFPFVRTLSDFLGAPVTGDTNRALRDQNLPRKTINSGPAKPIYKRYSHQPTLDTLSNKKDYENKKYRVLKKYGEKSFNKVEGMCEKYEREFKINFI